MAGTAGAGTGQLKLDLRVLQHRVMQPRVTCLQNPSFHPHIAVVPSAVQMSLLELAAAAARSGSMGLPTLTWLATSRSRHHWSTMICSAAAASGSLENLLFLRCLKDPCPWQATECAQLIHSCANWQKLQGNVKSARTHAHESAGLWTLAAQLQDTAVLRQLRSAGQVYPCNPEACHVLLQNRDTETLTWLFHECGACPNLALVHKVIAESEKILLTS